MTENINNIEVTIGDVKKCLNTVDTVKCLQKKVEAQNVKKEQNILGPEKVKNIDTNDIAYVGAFSVIVIVSYLVAKIYSPPQAKEREKLFMDKVDKDYYKSGLGKN